MAFFATILFPFESIWAFSTSSLIKEIRLWTDAIFTIPDKWIITNTLVSFVIPVSWSGAFYTIRSIFSCRANAFSSIPLSSWWWANTSIFLEVPLSWCWTRNTIVSISVNWAWTSICGITPLCFWWWACAIITNYYSR